MHARRILSASSRIPSGIVPGQWRTTLLVITGGLSVTAFGGDGGGGGPIGGVPCPYIITPIVHTVGPANGDCNLYTDCETGGETCVSAGTGLYEDCGTETQRFGHCVQYTGGTWNPTTGRCEGGVLFAEGDVDWIHISEFDPILCGGSGGSQ